LAAALLLFRGWALLPPSIPEDICLGIVSLVLGVLLFRFMFRRIVERNLTRIRTLSLSTPCAFSFQPWRSYLLMAVMIALGVMVRRSGLVPPAGLGTVLVAMAVPLGISAVWLLREGLRDG
jgi:hypothetical protein